MKKIILFFILMSIHFLSFSQKKLHDNNVKILYSYITDSLYKIENVKFLVKPYEINRKTNSYDVLKETHNNIGCYISIYQSLKENYDIDSTELSNLIIKERIITNKNIDTNKYVLVDNNKKSIFLSEPIYFRNKKFVIIGSVMLEFLSGVHVFIKENKKWKYLQTYCVSME